MDDSHDDNLTRCLARLDHVERIVSTGAVDKFNTAIYYLEYLWNRTYTHDLTSPLIVSLKLKYILHMMAQDVEEEMVQNCMDDYFPQLRLPKKEVTLYREFVEHLLADKTAQAEFFSCEYEKEFGASFMDKLKCVCKSVLADIRIDIEKVFRDHCDLKKSDVEVRGKLPKRRSAVEATSKLKDYYSKDLKSDDESYDSAPVSIREATNDSAPVIIREATNDSAPVSIRDATSSDNHEKLPPFLLQSRTMQGHRRNSGEATTSENGRKSSLSCKTENAFIYNLEDKENFSERNQEMSHEESVETFLQPGRFYASNLKNLHRPRYLRKQTNAENSQTTHSSITERQFSMKRRNVKPVCRKNLFRSCAKHCIGSRAIWKRKQTKRRNIKHKKDMNDIGIKSRQIRDENSDCNADDGINDQAYSPVLTVTYFNYETFAKENVKDTNNETVGCNANNEDQDDSKVIDRDYKDPENTDEDSIFVHANSVNVDANVAKEVDINGNYCIDEENKGDGVQSNDLLEECVNGAKEDISVLKVDFKSENGDYDGLQNALTEILSSRSDNVSLQNLSGKDCNGNKISEDSDFHGGFEDDVGNLFELDSIPFLSESDLDETDYDIDVIEPSIVSSDGIELDVFETDAQFGDCCNIKSLPDLTTFLMEKF